MARSDFDRLDPGNLTEPFGLRKGQNHVPDLGNPLYHRLRRYYDLPDAGDLADSFAGDVSGDLAAHEADTSDAHHASAVGFTPTGTIAATNAQSAIAEVAAEAVHPNLAAHDALGLATDAEAGAVAAAAVGDHELSLGTVHSAAQVTNTPSGTIAATDVQSAINELDTEKSGTAHTHTHAATTGQTANDHHAQAHAIGGADHTGTLAHSTLSGIGSGDHHSAANDPSSGEKAALAGTSGTPGSGNKYVTDADSRNTNSRAPSGAAGGDLGGTYPNPSVTDDSHNHGASTLTGTPGGELGGTWVSPTVDATHGGAGGTTWDSHNAVLTESNANLASHETAGVGDGIHIAGAITFTPAGTIAATNVQAAIEEVAAEAGGGAPTTADYLVGTAQGGLSAEIVVGATPGGELGGTWGSPTVDATHSGSAHHAQSHALASGTALGADHTLSGAAAGEVLRALSATTAAFDQLQHTDLGSVTADQHHAQAHHAAHETGGADAVKLDDLAAPDDNTDLNVSTAKHGLTPKLPNDATKYLDGTGAYTVPPGGGIAASLLDAKGDIIVASADNTPARLAIGSNGFVLTANSGATNGVNWAVDPSLAWQDNHLIDPDPHTGYLKEADIAAKGDLFAGTANDTVGIVTVGADDTILMADAAATAGVKWVAPATPVAVGTANAAGTSDDFARGSHVHAHEAAHVAHDTLWDTAGDLAVGSGADTAAKLGLTVPAANILNVLGVANGETTPAWKSIHDATNPAAIGTAAPGTSLITAHRDHVHATGAGTPANVAAAAATGAGPAAAMTDHVHAGPGGVASIVAASAGINTTHTQIVGFTIPANAIVAGTVMRIRANGIVTSTVGNAANFRARIGPTTLTGPIAAELVGTGTTTAAAAPFELELLMTCRTSGASGTVRGGGWLLCGTATAALTAFSRAVNMFTVLGAVTVDTTVSNIIELTFVSAAVTTTVTFHEAEIEIVKL